MTSFIACSSCERYIRSTETSCPFCAAAVAFAPAPRAHKALGDKRPSRAAVYAMRTAVLASAASAAVACGGLGGEERDGDNSSMSSGKGGAVASNEGAQGGASSQGAAAQGGAVASAGGTTAGDDQGFVPMELPEEGVDPEPQDGGFAPIPIYGGAFPDPMSRARV